MIDFSTLQGLTIPEGVVTQIADASGRVLWAVSGGKVVLEVEKVTSDTYAGETTYTGEQFILLDIYPKTNGTVKVTYGGLTKTITDTSGAEEPNAQEVFFGTFNGVSDSVATPESGELTIEGDYYAFSQAGWKTSSKSLDFAAPLPCITEIKNYGSVSLLPAYMLSHSSLTNGRIPSGVSEIFICAFQGCLGLTSVTIPNSVETLVSGAFEGCVNLTSFIVMDGNERFASEGGILFNKDKTSLLSYPSVTGHYTIPPNVTNIEMTAFGPGITSVTVLSTTPPTLGTAAFGNKSAPYVQSITVPKGCGDTYKAADVWSDYADLIVEAS